jgi:hypothetical protein
MNASPLYLGALKIDQERRLQAGDSKIIDALRQMLIGEPVCALEFHD